MDWNKSAFELINYELTTADKQNLIKNVNTEELFEGIEDHVDKTGSEFWANLEMLSFAGRLIRFVEDFAEKYNCDVAFLTSYGKFLDAPRGKLLSLKKNYLKHPVIFTREKYLLAHPRSFLIDDKEKFVKPFIANSSAGFIWPSQYLLEDENELEKAFTNLEIHLQWWVDGLN